MMAICGALLVFQLGQGKPIRGGLEVALGAEPEEGYLIGPAVASGYILENEKALYPRIAVGNGVDGYLEALLETKDGGPEWDMFRTLAKILVT
jgi:hypothetical protein